MKLGGGEGGVLKFSFKLVIGKQATKLGETFLHIVFPTPRNTVNYKNYHIFLIQASDLLLTFVSFYLK